MATALPGTGLLKGLGVTLKHMLKPAVTQQYPHVRPVLEPRTRGVIALMDENCTVCMLCSRECPDWCIYIDSHKETVPPAKEGGRARTRNVLDRFAIDFALCMYCGICIEVCPFDALWWSPEFEYAEYDQANLLHEKERLREWMDTVPPPPALDEGADAPKEVQDALEAAKKRLEASEQAAVAAETAAAAPAGEAAAAAPVARTGPKRAADIDIDVEVQIDQEVYDQLIADGKSERIARSKAKAAFVKKKKAEALAAMPPEGEAEAAPAAETTAEAPAAEAPAAEAPAAEPAQKKLADVEIEGEVQIDQATYDALIAEGKSERIARSKAKAAWVKAQKQKILDDEGGEA